MKKLIVITAAVMAFSFVTPQVAQAMKVQNQMAVIDDKDDKYKEVKVEELPEAVTKSVANAYTGYKIEKAFRGEDNSYKVKVAMGDLKYKLFYDEQGELIKVEDAASKEETTETWGTDPSNRSMEPDTTNITPGTQGEVPTNETENAPVE
jgi:hypothetical protein